MDAGLLFSVSNLIWLAFSLQLLGFAVRDELKLRLLMLVGGILYVLYFYLPSDGPHWSSVITNALLVTVNFSVILIVLYERTMIGITGETADVFRRFPLLKPGQFRRLYRAGKMMRSDGSVLLERGEHPDTLYYVLDGEGFVSKGDSEISIGNDVFLGEVAYLTGAPASATVRLSEGTRYIAWRHDALQRMIDERRDMQLAVVALLNLDMARKVAASVPVEIARSA